MPDPLCLSLVLCDQVIEDKRTNKKSLIGVFNEILVSRLPAAHDCMFLFVTLTNCRGQHDLSIELSHGGDYDEERILQINGQINAHNPMDIIDLVFELRGTPFKSVGKYTIDIQSLTSGNRLAQRFFHVRQIPAPPEAPEPPQPPFQSLS